MRRLILDYWNRLVLRFLQLDIAMLEQRRNAIERDLPELRAEEARMLILVSQSTSEQTA